MENKQVMAIIAIIVVVLVVVVAVLLMQPSAPPSTGGPGGGQPGTGTGDTGEPGATTGPGDTGEPPSGGEGIENIVNAISTGMPVYCDITIQDIPMKLWIEGQKMRAEASSAGLDMIVISDGTGTVYMNFGDDWLKYVADEEEVEALATTPSPEEIRESLESVPDVESNCEVLADIPDSQFQLPAGVTALGYDEWLESLMGDFELPEGY